MTEHQKPQEDVADADDATTQAKMERATAALAGAVAKRTEARKVNDRAGGRGSHGGKPISNLKVADQTRGKKG